MYNSEGGDSMDDNFTETLKRGKIYTRKQLISAMQVCVPSLQKSTLQWALGDMLEQGKLVKDGYNSYRLPREQEKATYSPQYSEQAMQLKDKLLEKYPYSAFVVFETVLMNEFLNHLIAQNTIFIQAEKEESIFVFRALQELGYENVLYKPSPKDFTLYWIPNCIVVTDMISEAPLGREKPHDIILEKMLVDMYCDKIITGTFSKSEYSDVLTQAAKEYRIDATKMLRYARRRNREKELSELFTKCI